MPENMKVPILSQTVQMDPRGKMEEKNSLEVKSSEWKETYYSWSLPSTLEKMQMGQK